MSFEKKWVYMNDNDWTVPEREYLGIAESNVRSYARSNPMPKNPLYDDVNELVQDLIGPKGAMLLDPETPYEFIAWLEELMYECTFSSDGDVVELTCPNCGRVEKVKLDDFEDFAENYEVHIFGGEWDFTCCGIHGVFKKQQSIPEMLYNKIEREINSALYHREPFEFEFSLYVDGKSPIEHKYFVKGDAGSLIQIEDPQYNDTVSYIEFTVELGEETNKYLAVVLNYQPSPMTIRSSIIEDPEEVARILKQFENQPEGW